MEKFILDFWVKYLTQSREIGFRKFLRISVAFLSLSRFFYFYFSKIFLNLDF